MEVVRRIHCTGERENFVDSSSPPCGHGVVRFHDPLVSRGTRLVMVGMVNVDSGGPPPEVVDGY